jgi:hypothetical protein
MKDPAMKHTVLPSMLLDPLLVSFLFACEEEKKEEAAPAKPSASAVAAAPTPAPTPPPPPKPREDCPEGSSGIGTSGEPCLGSGTTRMMEVTWSGKTTEEGPKFKVVNKTKKSILFGSVAVYFYDKKGKQLEITHGGKARTMQLCSGNIFAGAVKPDEKIFVFFSCVKKEHVPEGTTTIEAEVKLVGFTDEAGSQSEYYWSNPDLVPDERPKGGIKVKPTKKK